jgi:hypothetical protein
MCSTPRRHAEAAWFARSSRLQEAAETLARSFIDGRSPVSVALTR